MARKAAVIIGVDSGGGLAPLKSAAHGANSVASWLDAEGYTVECLTDTRGPVRSRDVEDAIARLVTNPPRFSLLLVYFSGHGYWHVNTDHWLLSDAPTKPNEAINLESSMDLAKYSGIPNVVFVSDACRSLPATRSAASINGIAAFPNYEDIRTPSKVDCFKATGEALAAYEGFMQESQSIQSVLTHALLSAYESPEPYMLRDVLEDGAQITVVPNRRLERYLQTKVDDVLEEMNINLRQRIEANVPSDDDTFIARIKRTRRQGATPQGLKADSNLQFSPQDAPAAITRALAAADDDMFAVDTDTEIELALRLPAEEITSFETQVGITVSGAQVKTVVPTRGTAGATAELVESGDGISKPAVIRLHRVEPAVSVAIELADGRCVVIAALPGYIAHANISSKGLINVNYVPSSNHSRWTQYAHKKEKITRLRALVALAVAKNRFLLSDEHEAEVLAKAIRIEKATDPALGLYAAHAYSQASQDKHVRSVLEFMRKDILVDLLDVRALASRQLNEAWGAYPIVPFCPMLTQSWNRLKPRGVDLPEVLESSIPYLCDSLWTTFQPQRASVIMNAVETGELK